MSAKLEVTYRPSDKTAHVPAGTTLFNAANWAGLPIESTCGGRGTCGKCKVRILQGEAEPTPADHRKLDAGEIADAWRLSCQVEIHDDIECDVPRLMSMPKAATMGVNRFVLLEPNVAKVAVTLPEPSLEDHRSALTRLAAALDEEGYETNPCTRVLAELAIALREEDLDVTAVIVGDHLVAVEPGDTTETMYGVAFDIGTTTVVGTLIDLRAGAPAAVASTINKQAPFGGDVIARMGHAMKGDEELEQLRSAAVATINEVLQELYAESGIPRENVYELVIAGNATMLSLLVGVDPRSIALSPFTATFLEPLDLPAEDVGLNIHPDGRVQTFPSIGAYVGADIVADVVATGLVREDRTRLLVDVGTNGEIVCGSSERSAASSAPAGPAFEGGQILHGMRATDGAIEGVTLTGGTVELQVIGGENGAEPRGLCGSGLIDAVAQLRLTGLLQENGLYMNDEQAAALPLGDRFIDLDGIRAFEIAPGVVLTQLDVRELQSAKGSIATGIEVVMETLGLKADDLEEVMLAGSFGSYINPESARVVGLVPPVAVEKIVAAGNAASEGAKMALLSFREREIAFELPNVIEYIELSGAEDFNERFIRNLAFPSLEQVAAA